MASFWNKYVNVLNTDTNTHLSGDYLLWYLQHTTRVLADSHPKLKHNVRSVLQTHIDAAVQSPEVFTSLNPTPKPFNRDTLQKWFQAINIYIYGIVNNQVELLKVENSILVSLVNFYSTTKQHELKVHQLLCSLDFLCEEQWKEYSAKMKKDANRKKHLQRNKSHKIRKGLDGTLNTTLEWTSVVRCLADLYFTFQSSTQTIDESDMPYFINCILFSLMWSCGHKSVASTSPTVDSNEDIDINNLRIIPYDYASKHQDWPSTLEDLLKLYMKNMTLLRRIQQNIQDIYEKQVQGSTTNPNNSHVLLLLRKLDAAFTSTSVICYHNLQLARKKRQQKKQEQQPNTKTNENNVFELTAEEAAQAKEFQSLEQYAKEVQDKKEEKEELAKLYEEKINLEFERSWSGLLNWQRKIYEHPQFCGQDNILLYLKSKIMKEKEKEVEVEGTSK